MQLHHSPRALPADHPSHFPLPAFPCAFSPHYFDASKYDLDGMIDETIKALGRLKL